MRRQKGYFKIVTNTQSITSDTFTSSRVFVLAGPREKFTENEFDHLRRYLETGGSILVLLGEGGEKRQFVKFILYHKVASSRLSRLVAQLRIFRLFMKGKFDAYVL